MIELGDRDEIRRLYNKPANRRLKNWALGIISVAAVILISIIFLMDCVSFKVILLLKICAGLLAMVFAALYVSLVYRVYSEYHKPKR